jgi:membrane peptidoglycan carboxypeptidase
VSGRRKATPSRASKRPASAKPPTKSSRPSKKPSRKPPRKRSRAQLIGRILGWLTLGFLVATLAGIGAFVYAYQHIVIPTPNSAFQAQTTFVYYADGKSKIGSFATQNRSDISLADLPPSVKWAVIAAEDRSFETNVGFDPKGILRALVNDLRGGSLQGASTITQQYVKILYLNQQQTITRKVKEAIIAIKINQQESKDQILQGYLNTIYFGRGAYGIQAAAHAYFGVDARKLNVRQSAALAAIINSPIYLDPANGAASQQALLDRYRYVLSGMEQMGNLDAAAAAKDSLALPTFPTLHTGETYRGQRGHILTMVKQELLDQGFTSEQLTNGGLRIVTTFDKKMMGQAAAAVRRQRPTGKQFSDKNLHVALASIEPGSGALRAMYAGQDFLEKKNNKAQINWATTPPAAGPGSTFKPFTLAAGLEAGYSLKSEFQGNSPIDINGYKFKNEGGGGGNDYGKRVTLLRGLEQSINTVYIDLTNSIPNGPQKVIDVATALGIPSDAPGLKPPVVGVTLGSASVAPVSMAAAYATFANGGVSAQWYDIQSVTTADGQVLFEHQPKKRNALPVDVNADVTYALQQVVQHGTGTAALALGRPAGGKTGTATDSAGNVDSAWFVGFTPQLSTAVMYVRGPNGNGRLDGWLPSYYGAAYPAQTWTAFMKLALKGSPALSFPPPANKLATNLDHPTYSPAPKPTASPTPTDSASPTQSPTATDSPTATSTASATLPVPSGAAAVPKLPATSSPGP